MTADLIGTYKKIKPSVVAIVAKISKNPDFPDIIGTGFVVREEGLILTNNHVIDAIPRLPKLKDAKEDDWPAKVIIFNNLEGVGMQHVMMDVKGAFKVSIDPLPTYGGRNLDVGFLRVAVKDLPAVEVEESPIYEEGQEIAIAGFPMGTELLRAPGNLHQINMTLKRGVIGAILPFPCQNPHALLLDLLTQGGSSGSPVFNTENGKVIGVLYGGIEEPKAIGGGPNGLLVYKNPTGISYAVPSHYFANVLKKIDENQEWRNHDIGEVKSLKDIIKDGLDKYKSGEPRNEPIPVGQNEILFVKQ